MIVCLQKEIGGLLASDRPLYQVGLIECDGRTVLRRDFPQLCRGADSVLMPDLRGTVPGIWFYVIGKLSDQRLA